MYSTCLFCHAGLGRNEVIEAFPVGRRLAFDAANGRLWVVCRKCERWNLSPLEERWAAIDACERLYRDTRTRVSTDEIGLARLREGTELVRIGKPLRPEFAAWRYGDQFGRRYRRFLVYGSGILGVTCAAALAPHVLGTAATVGSFLSLVQLGYSADHYYRTRRRSYARLRLPDGRVQGMTQWNLLRSQLTALPETGDWALTLRFRPPGRHFTAGKATVTLCGEDARHAAVAMLPGVNASGANAATVRDALALFEQHAGREPHHLFNVAARTRRGRIGGDDLPHTIGALPVPMRLALEMASHEERERRAMQGELALLEAAWKDAESLATIADTL